MWESLGDLLASHVVFLFLLPHDCHIPRGMKNYFHTMTFFSASREVRNVSVRDILSSSFY